MTDMKDSKLWWVGDIPSEWKVAPVKYFSRSHKDIAGDRSEDYQRIALTMNGVIPRSKDDGNGLQPENFDSYQIVHDGDIIFKLIDLENVKTSRVGLSRYEGICSPAYILLTMNPSEMNNRYAEYYYKMMWYNHIFNRLGNEGVRSAINVGMLLETPIVIPPLPEQRAIADFLDEKTRAIDTMIAGRQEMLEHLAEYRSTLISEIITKGLPSEREDREFNDSGIEWIGEIPVEWSKTRIKYVSEVLNGYSFKSECYTDEGLNIIRINNVCDGYVDVSDATHYPMTYLDQIGHCKLHAGDLVMSLTGNVGRVGFIEERHLPAGMNQRVALIRMKNDEMLVRFLYYFFRTNNFFVEANNSHGRTAQLNMSTEWLKSLSIPLPPVEEQQRIVDYLDTKINEIDTASDIIKSEIEDLKEYRKSLIYEYTTGKKRVAIK